MSIESELKYHLVWCTKYRRKVLTDEIQESLKIFIKEVCDKNNFEIESLEIMEDHIEITIKTTSRNSVHRIVSQIKGFTASNLRGTFPTLRTKLPCLWTRNYYVTTVGHVSEETVKKYIENQKNA